MISRTQSVFFAGLCSGVLCLSSAFAQTPSPSAPRKLDKAAAYYHYSMGHLYAELAAAYGNRGEYVSRAIESYREAMKADPAASFLADELSDLYLQSGRISEGAKAAEESIRQNPNDINSRRILGRLYTRLIGDTQQGKVNETMLRQAIEQYSAIAKAEPKDTEVWLMLGRLYKISQDSVESEKAYKKVLELDANNEDAMMGLAMVYSDIGNQKAASEMLQAVANRNPSLRTLTALAGTYEQMRDYKGAAAALEKALEISQGNPDLKRALAQNLMLSEQFDRAQKLFEGLVAEDPKDIQSLLRLSQIHRQQRNLAKAREVNDRAKAIDPTNLEILYNDVNLLEAEGKIGEAIAQLKDIVSQSAKRQYTQGERGNRAILLERLGMMYRSAEHYQAAIDTFKQVLELEPEQASRTHMQIAETYRINREYQKALAEVEGALKKLPEERSLKVLRASVLADLAKPDQAMAELKQLLDGKNDRETYLAIAQIHEKARNFAEMEKAIARAETLSASPEDRQTIFFMRGAMYEKMKKFDAAEEQFREVLKLDPDNASAMNYLGYMLADRNVRLAEAQQFIAKALEQEPNNPAYLDSLGWVYYRMGKLPEAEEQLRRAVDRFSRDPTVHDHLGDVYNQQGKLKEAIAQWQRSLKEWESTAPSELDQSEITRIQKKLEGAKVRLAKEPAGSRTKQQ